MEKGIETSTLGFLKKRWRSSLKQTTFAMIAVWNTVKREKGELSPYTKVIVGGVKKRKAFATIGITDTQRG